MPENRPFRPSKRAFSLLELLAAIAVVTVLFTVLLGGILPRAMQSAKMAKSTSNLRQLGIACHLYTMEHDEAFFPYRQEVAEGTLWFFGLEAGGSQGQAEGERDLDVTRGPLFPYLEAIGGVEVCPGFDYGSALWKPKFRGASWGYGYNLLLSPLYFGNGEVRKAGKRMSDLSHPSQVILFATCAQVNTFQAPASPENPMLEEFYFVDDVNRTFHFRFGGGNTALCLFADGSVRGMSPHPGTLDTRLAGANVGRITPRGSRLYLE